MNTDIRLSVGIVSHPKTVKLMRRCGDRAFFSLISLWTWAAQYRPDGILNGMDKEDIEIASGWQGEPGRFVDELIALHFIDEKDDNFSIHEWSEHNSWAAKVGERGDQARFSRLAKINRELYDKLKNEGISSLSKEEYERFTNERSTNVNASLTPAPAPAPAPAPSPAPSLKKEKALSVISPKENQFEIFWNAYPVHVGITEAEARWEKLRKSKKLPDLNTLLSAIQKQRDWRERAGPDEFRPEWKHPATWLNKGCWDDEIPEQHPLAGKVSTVTLNNLAVLEAWRPPQ